jgi:hypothetical protein
MAYRAWVNHKARTNITLESRPHLAHGFPQKGDTDEADTA